MRDRSFLIVGGCYVAARLLVTSWSMTRFYDSTAYEGAVSFTGAADRLWLVPLFFRLSPDRATIALHATISAVAFLAVALAIASTMHRQAVRVAVIAAVLLVGLTPRVVVWDAAALSESLAISLTLLLIAVAVWWRAAPSWVVVAVFTGWVFVRDAHALLALLVAVMMVFAAVRAGRRGLAVAVVAVSLWGVVASQNSRHVEGLNALSFAAFKVAPHDDRYDWFVDRGMPSFDRTSSEYRLRDELMVDDEFVDWAGNDGVSTVTRWLALNPGYTLAAAPHLFADDELNRESAVDMPRIVGDLSERSPVGLPADLAPLLAALSAVAVLGALLFADRRWWLPGILAVSAIPHTLLVYHAVPLELARHAIVLTLVMLLALVWLVALTLESIADQAGGSGQRPSVIVALPIPHSSDAAAAETMTSTSLPD